MPESALTIILDQVALWSSSLASFSPNLLAAAVVFLVFVVIARLTRFVARKIIRRSSPILIQIAGGTSQTIVLLLGLIAVLQILQLDKLVTSVLAGAGIVGLAVGFAFQDFFGNFIAGLAMTIRTPFGVGDLVKTGDIFGKVQAVNLRTTIINTLDGQLVEIANKDVYQNPIINYSELPYRRITLKFGVGYDSDLDLVKKVLTQGLETLSTVRPPKVYFSGFQDSAIGVLVFFWIDTTSQLGYFQQRSEAIKIIQQLCKQHKIEMPYPTQVVKLTNLDLSNQA